jgi:hypothetical protein
VTTTGKARISIGFTLLLGIVITLLFFLFVDIEEVGSQLRQADPGYLGLATLLLLAGYVVYALRWQLLLHRIPSLLDTFHASNLGHLLNMLLPLRPGEPLRIVALNRSSGAGVGQLTSSVVIERMLETVLRLAAFGGMLVIGFGFTNSPGILAGLGVFLLVALLVIVGMVKQREKILKYLPPYLGRIPRLSQEQARRSLAELLDALVAMSSPRSLAFGLLTSTLAAGFFLGYHYFALLALDFPLTQSQLLALSLGVLLISPPSAPTLPGIYHAQFIVFAALGISASYLAASAIVLHALQTVALVVLGSWAMYKTGSSLGHLIRRKVPVPVPVEVDSTSRS